MYKLCYLLIHLFNLCDPLCKVLHLACSPTFAFRAVSTSVVQIKKIMNAALILINLRSRLGLKIKEQKKGKLMIFSLISQRLGLQLIPDFPSPLFLTHTHTYSPGPGNCLSVTAGRIHRSILRKCICKDTEVLFRSKPLILKRPPPSFLPLRYWHQCN